MKRRQALTWIREKAEAAPDLDPVYAEIAALRWMEGRNPPHNVHHAGAREEILDEARRLQGESAGEQQGEVARIELPPGTAMLSERLVEALRPWVDEVREELEGRDPELDLPFTDRDAAADWIERVAEEDGRQFTEEERERIFELRREIRRRTRRLTALLGAPDHHQDPHNLPTVPYARADDATVRHVSARRDTRLWPLARDLEDVAEATGFRKLQVVLLVLTDREPVLAPITIGSRHKARPLPTGGSISRDVVKLEIRSPEISLEGLKTVYRAIRRHFGVTERNRLTEKDYALDRVIRDLGGAPEGRAPRGFWPEVAERLSEEGWEGPSADAWRKRWNRMQDRRDRLGVLEEPEEEESPAEERFSEPAVEEE